MFTTGKYQINTNLRIRAEASTKSFQIGRLGQASQVLVVSVVYNQNEKIWFGKIVAQVDVDDSMTGWIALQQGIAVYATRINDQNVPPDNPNDDPFFSILKWGVHCHDSQGHKYVYPAIQFGAEAVVIMEGYQFCREIKDRHPNVVVMCRRWLQGNFVPNPTLDLLWGAEDPRLVYLSPLNEADNVDQDEDGIRRRAQFDSAMATMVKQRTGGRYNQQTQRWEGGATYVCSPYSMGTPDFTKQSVIDAVRMNLAPPYNMNLLAYGYHSYSPRPGHIDDPNAWPWFERRADFVFTHCGFNPDPTLAGVYMDETGMDQGGIGGYLAHGLNTGQIESHMTKLSTALRRPLVVNGKKHKSPYKAAAVFAATDSERWAGYRVQHALPEIGRVAQLSLK